MKPIYAEASAGGQIDAWLEGDGRRIPLRLVDDELRALGFPGRPLPNDQRDIPVDIARRATFAVPIANPERIVDRRVTPGASAGALDERTLANIEQVVAVMNAIEPFADAIDRMAPVMATIAAAHPYVETAHPYVEGASPCIEAFSRVAPALERYGGVIGSLTPIPFPDGRGGNKPPFRLEQRPLSTDELAELERIGLDLFAR